MANGKSFLTGLVSGIGQGVQSRNSEEKALSKTILDTYLKQMLIQSMISNAPKDARKTGYTFDATAGYVPKYDIPTAEQNLKEAEASELLGRGGYGDQTTMGSIVSGQQGQPGLVQTPQGSNRMTLGGILGAKARIAQEEAIGKEQAKTQQDIFRGKLVSRHNLELVTNTVRQMTDVAVKGWDEQGMGGIVQAKTGQLATKIGDLPEWAGGVEIGGRFPESGAFPGKRAELIMKIMPMLTQQPTKPEGSIRLITTVLEMYGKSIPDINTAPRTYVSQLRETIYSMIGFARAAETMGRSFDEEFQGRPVEEIPDQELTSWISDIGQMAGDIQYSPQEQKTVDTLVNSSLEKAQKWIEKRHQGKKSTVGDIAGKKYVDTGTYNGRKVGKLPDGTVEYIDE